MERNIGITKYISKLTRSNLIEYLVEKKVNTEAVQILKSRDIDGERFLNFTELDLVQWGLKKDQKKILLNCRNQLINETTQAMSAKPTVSKIPAPFTIRKPFKSQNRSMNYTNNNKETATQTKAQLLAPPSSSEEIYYDRKKPTQANLQCYMDMNQAKGIAVANKEYYLDANHKPEQIRCFMVSKGSTRPLSKRSESLNRLSETTRNDLEKIFANLRPPLHPHPNTEVRNTSFEVKRRAARIPPSTTGKYYLESKTTSASVFNYSVHEGHQSKYENELKNSSTPTQNRKYQQVGDSINKVSIQNCPLPPIPKQINRRDHKCSALPPIANAFEVLNPKGKPPVTPKPPKEKNAKSTSSGKITFDLNNDLDFERFPPPPPEFLTEEDDVAERTDTSMLPRPPAFIGIFEPYQIAQFREMLSPVRTPTSDDDDSCNLNNFSYYRNTDRKGAKQLLEKIPNLEDGTFLLRQSNRDSYYLGLTIFQDNHYYNIGIKKDSRGKFYCEPFNARSILKFETLFDFVEYYKYNSLAVKSRNEKVVELYLKHPLPNYVF